MRRANPWAAIHLVGVMVGVFLSALPAAQAGDEKPKRAAGPTAVNGDETADADQEAPVGNGKEFRHALSEAHKKAVARDAPAAIDAYRAAILLEPNNPAGHYFLGAAQLLKGDLADADASWATALRYAIKAEKWRAKILFAVADLRERQVRFDDAKVAWETYRKFLEDHPSLRGYDATAIERKRVIDVHRELAKKYGEVKKRIEQRLKEASRPPAS